MFINCYAIHDFFCFSRFIYSNIQQFSGSQNIACSCSVQNKSYCKAEWRQKRIFFPLFSYTVGDNKMNLISASSPNMLGRWFWNVKESRVLMFSTVSYDRSACYRLTMVKQVILVASVPHVSHVPYDVSCRISCNVCTTYPPKRSEWNSSNILL